MDERLITIQVGAILCDIGKIVKRAQINNDDYYLAGLNFLKKFPILENNNELYEIVEHHTSQTLKNAQIDNNSLAYIVHEANNIACGSDIEKTEDLNLGMMPLDSVFNNVHTEKNKIKKSFSIADFDKYSFNMPKKSEANLCTDDYKKILEEIQKKFPTNIESKFLPEKLGIVFEETCSYIPSNSLDEYSDISYYDHAKITSGLSACMYIYDKENDITDFRQEYFSNIENSRNIEKFLFVSGEFTGIQDFIYTITSKMAMKSLRGRSFFLEMFIEHIIDEILSQLSLSRLNLIYSGGSQFYMLLPNIEKSKEILKNYKDIVNDFLLEQVGTNVYFETSYTPTTAEELGNGLNNSKKSENKIGNIFRRLSIQVSKNKLSRYSKEQLAELFNEDSCTNKIESYTKECIICKKSEKEEILKQNTKMEGFTGIEVCGSCKHYIKLGSAIAKLYHSNSNEKKEFIVELNDKPEEKDTVLIFPKYDSTRVHLQLMDKNKIEQRKDSIHRYYSINSYDMSDKLCKNIWIGNYNIYDSETNGQKLIEFENLVKLSKGIERLAVFRADVDNLGMLFQSGFEDKSSDEAYKTVTLSKSAVMSRYLSDFFKRRINLILSKKDGANESNEIFKKYCNIIKENDSNLRDIVVVYSGGDDIFAIGTWNEVIEFAIDLRTAFKEFTNNKITLSAGIGFFQDSFPVYQMASRTGELESIAKSYMRNNKITKDAVALFGKMNNNKLNHVYCWDDFIEKVLEEKYKYLKETVSLEDGTDKEKVFVGKSKWYKIIQLISNRLTKEEKRIDIARFAYTLARISSTKDNEENYESLKRNLLMWMKNEEDAKQLLTAINILIYEVREGKKNDKQ